MHSSQALNRLLATARRAGFEVRFELLDGTGGAACQLKGRKILFVDLSAGTQEQLAAVTQALLKFGVPLPPEVQPLVQQIDSARHVA